MKKLALTALTVLSCGMACALPVGNPTDASLYTNGVWCGRTCVNPCDPCFSWCDAFSVRFGFYGDYVFNRHMKLKSGNESDINRFQLYTNAGLLAVNICDWVDVFATFGATNIYLETSGSSFSNLDRSYALTWSPDFSWSVGARATIWECDCFGVGLEGQYFQTTPDLNSALSGVTGAYTYFNSGNSMTYGEWQVGLGASYTFTVANPGTEFVPYIGVKWAGSTFDMNSQSYTSPDAATYTHRDLESAKLWGYCVGFTATQNETMGVTVEGRFADEKAVHVNGQIRF